MSKCVAVISHNPFAPHKGQELIPLESEGLCLGEILQQLGVSKHHQCIVAHNGVYVLRSQWARLRPKSGVVQVTYLIAGGGGSGKNPLTAILTIALMAFAPMAAGALGGMLGMTGAPMLGILKAGIMMLGGAIVQNIGPTPQPANQSVMDVRAASPTYSLGANGNTMRLGQAIPVIYGQMRVYPDFAASPWAWYDNTNNDQYLLQVFVVSYGKRLLDKVLLEDSAIASFEGAIWAAAYFTKEGVRHWTGGSHDLATIEATFPLGCEKIVVASEVSGQDLGNSWLGGYVVNSPGTLIRDIEYDIICPRGLYYANDNGSLASKSVEWSIEYRTIDDDGNATGGWVALTSTRTVSQSGSKSGILTPAYIEYGNSNYGDYYEVVPNTGTIYIDLGAKNVSNVVLSSPATINSWSLDTSGATDRVVISLTTVRVYNTDWRGDYTGTTWQNSVSVSYNYTVTTTAQAMILTAATNDTIRRTYRFGVPQGRYEVRARRVDAKDESSRVAHDISWGGLKGVLVADPYWRDITILYTRLKATQGLSGAVTRKLNCLATANLSAPYLSTTAADPNQLWHIQGVINGTLTPNDALWANPAMALWDVLTSWYGGEVKPHLIDKESLTILHSFCVDRRFRFDAVIDSQQPIWDVVRKIAGVAMAEPLQQGKMLRFIIDKPRLIPVMGFRSDNIVKGSLRVQSLQVASDTPTNVVVFYRNRATWRDTTYPAYDPNRKTAQIEAFGVTTTKHAADLVAYHSNKNRFRRKVITFVTELEGMIPTAGDLITITHDLVARGKTFRVKRIINPFQFGGYTETDWVAIEFYEAIDVSELGDFTIASLRMVSGAPTSPIPISWRYGTYDDVSGYFLKLPIPLPLGTRLNIDDPIVLGREGVEKYTQHAIVKSTRPAQKNQVQVEAWGYDARVYSQAVYQEATRFEGYINFTFNSLEASMRITWPAQTNVSYYSVEATFYPRYGDATQVVTALNSNTTNTYADTLAVKDTGYWILHVIAHLTDGTQSTVTYNSALLTYVPPPTQIIWGPMFDLTWITAAEHAAWSKATNATSYDYVVWGYGSLSDPAIDSGFFLSTQQPYTVQSGTIAQPSGVGAITVNYTAANWGNGVYVWDLGGGKSYMLGLDQIKVTVTARNATMALSKTS